MISNDELRHDVPFPWGLRLIFCAVGAFIAIIAPYELWRGVWPLNVTTPFFAMLIIAGWSGAYAALTAGLFTPEKLYVFRHGALNVTDTVLMQTRTRHYLARDIVSIDSAVMPDSDGPDRFVVRISLANGDVHQSRMFDTEATARKHAEEIRRVLGV